MMNMATVLRYTANAVAVAGLVKLVAGDLAAEALGQVSLIARDLLQYLPAAFKQCSAR